MIPEEPAAENEEPEELTEQEASLQEDEEEVLGSGMTVASDEKIKTQGSIDGYVDNLTWSMRRASDDSEPDVNLGSDPSVYASGFDHYEEVYLSMKFDIKANPGKEFNEGEEVVIPITPSSTILQYASTAPMPFYASDGTVLGEWKIGGLNGANIVIKLYDTVNGQVFLSNCEIKTGSNLRVRNPKVADIVNTYSVNGIERQYKIKELKRNVQTAPILKTASATTNNTAGWIISGSSLANHLTTSMGNSSAGVTSYIIEDEIPASEGVRELRVSGIVAVLPYIMSPLDTRTAKLGGNDLLWSSDISGDYFTEIKQDPTDTYESFRKKVGPFEYGIFKTNDGSFKFIINFGSPEDTTYKVKYTDLWPDLKQTILDVDKGVTEEEAEIISKSLGNDNCIQGNMVFWVTCLSATYNQAFVDTIKTNTAIRNDVQDGNSISYSDSSQATLKAGSGIATPASESATIAKADSVSGAALGGVTFKLQSSTTETGTYSDTTYGPNSDGTFVTSSADDNTKGTVNTGTLAPGWYKFVEVSGLDGYAGTYTSDPFQILGSGAGVVVVATNTPIDYTVHYDINGATSAAIADKTNVKYWDADLLPSTTPTKPGYKFEGWKLSKRADTALSADDIKNGSAVADTAKYQDLALADTVAHITLQAQWSPKTAATLAPEVSKTVTGTLPATEAFTFNIALDPGTQTNVTMPTDTTATTSAITTGDTTAIFDSISFSQAGTYTFKVTETAGTTNNLTYDDSEIIMTVVVTEEATALVAGTPTFSKAGEDSTLAFTNAYAPDPVDAAALDIEKVLTGDTPDVDETFNFELAASDASSPLPTETTLSITGAGTDAFDTWTYTAAGTYTYEVTEQAGTNTAYTYDSTVYTVTDTVTDTAGVLSVDREISNGTDVVTEITFTNAYAPQSVSSTALDIEKVLSGDTPDVDETFNFELVASNTTNPLPTDTEISITGEGTESFGTWTYTSAGSYTYTITEQAGTNVAYTYDSTIYTITDTVTDTAGVLSVAREISNGTDVVNSVSFTNTYTKPNVIPDEMEMAITKSVDRERTKPGENVTYTLHVENTGTTIIDTLYVKDAIPAHTTFVSATEGGVLVEDAAGNYVEWNLSDLAVGAKVSLQMVVTVDADTENGAIIENTAVYSLSGAPEEPTNKVETPVDAEVPDNTPVVIVTKSVDKQEAKPGDTLTYTLLVKNTGTGVAEEIYVKDYIPVNTTYVSSSTNANANYVFADNPFVEWTINDLEAGAQIALELTVKINEDVSEPTTIQNIANYKDPISGEDKQSNQVETSVTIDQDTPTPVNGTKPGATKTSAPKTGDNPLLYVFGASAFIALCVCIGIFARRKKGAHK